jgi:kinesin family protein 20
MTPGVIREVRKYVPDPPMLPSDTEDAELTESEDGTVDTNSVGVSAATGSEEEEDDDEDEDEEEDWLPSAAKTPRAKPAPQRLASPSPAPRLNTQDAAKPRISKLARGMSHLTLSVADPDDSVIIVPAFRARQESSEYEDQEEPGTTAIKKKKRCVMFWLVNFGNLRCILGSLQRNQSLLRTR